MVLFTDGEDFSSNLSRVKRRAQKQGLHIFTLGIGTPEGAPIPLCDEQGREQQKNPIPLGSFLLFAGKAVVEKKRIADTKRRMKRDRLEAKRKVKLLEKARKKKMAETKKKEKVVASPSPIGSVDWLNEFKKRPKTSGK